MIRIVRGLGGRVGMRQPRGTGQVLDGRMGLGDQSERRSDEGSGRMGE